MKTSKWLAGSAIYLALGCVFLTGCEDPTDKHEEYYGSTGENVDVINNPGIASAWADIQSGFVTTLNGNGTYSVSTATGTPVQTGTWTTSGNQITFTPNGDVPATMTYSVSGDTMTITDGGETTVFTR